MFAKIPLVILFIYIQCALTNADLPCSARAGDLGQGKICVCNSSYCDTVERPYRLPVGQYHLYTTSNSTPGFTHSTGTFKTDASKVEDNDVVFVVNSTMKYQEIKGFGGSFTDSAGIVIDSLPIAAQDKLIESYFSTSGLEYNFCRIPIGSTDFSARRYSLDDDPGDYSLDNFALADEDYKYRIRYIKKAQAVCPYNISIVACSWSAPEWMKTRNRLYPSELTGWLKMEHYGRWADYHVKFIQAYQKNGVDIWGVSGGNEPALPLVSKVNLNNTISFAHQHRFWLKKHLLPALKAANLDYVKYLTMEDTRLYQDYWMNRFSKDAEVYEMVEGIGVHWYADYFVPATVFDIFHKKFPEKPIYYTESSINVSFAPSSEAVKLGSWERAALYIYNIIENLNHWVVSYIDWNLALDLAGGPTLNLPIDASVIVNTTSGEFYKNPLFYALGHFSKFIPPKSKRVQIYNNLNESSHVHTRESGEYTGSNINDPTWHILAPSVVVSVATANSDGSNTVIVLNNKNDSIQMRLEIPGVGFISQVLEQRSVNTFLYWLQ